MGLVVATGLLVGGVMVVGGDGGEAVESVELRRNSTRRLRRAQCTGGTYGFSNRAELAKYLFFNLKV